MFFSAFLVDDGGVGVRSLFANICGVLDAILLEFVSVRFLFRFFASDSRFPFWVLRNHWEVHVEAFVQQLVIGGMAYFSQFRRSGA